MAAGEWDYSDYITYDESTTTYLTRLRLHIQEVSNKLITGSYSLGGRSVSKGFLQDYLKDLQAKEKRAADIQGAGSGTRSSFTRGRAIP